MWWVTFVTCKDIASRINPFGPKVSSERSVKDLSGLYLEKTGGAEGIRTLDLLDAIEARSQLRHGPTANKRITFYNTPMWGASNK